MVGEDAADLLAWTIWHSLGILNLISTSVQRSKMEYICPHTALFLKPPSHMHSIASSTYNIPSPDLQIKTVLASNWSVLEQASLPARANHPLSFVPSRPHHLHCARFLLPTTPRATAIATCYSPCWMPRAPRTRCVCFRSPGTLLNVLPPEARLFCGTPADDAWGTAGSSIPIATSNTTHPCETRHAIIFADTARQPASDLPPTPLILKPLIAKRWRLLAKCWEGHCHPSSP